jgi:pyruvate dehydrogenase E2 component (dihydrolipoamide acetyltransferase)
MAEIDTGKATILAIGAGEKHPWVMLDGQLGFATVITATGSFADCAIDGVSNAQLMPAFKQYVERSLGMVA